MVEIGDQSARRRQHRARKVSKGIKRRHRVQRFQPICPGIAGEGAARAMNNNIASPREGGDIIQHGATLPEIPAFAGMHFGHHHFARVNPSQRRAEHFGRAFLQHHRAGRNIASGDSD